MFGIFGAVIGIATTIGETLAIIGLAVEGLKAVCNLVETLCKALGLIESETDVEELGDKAIQSGYNPEDYDSYAEYVEAVKAFDDLDPEKSKQISEEEKITKGTELQAGLLAEKYSDYPIEEFLEMIIDKNEYFTNEKMAEIAKIIEENPSEISSITGYLNGSERDSIKNEAAIKTLIGLEKAVNPGISDFDAMKSVVNSRG